MKYLFYIINFVAFVLNLNAPAQFSNMSAFSLLLEYLVVLLIANVLITRMTPKQKNIQNRFKIFFLLSFTVGLLILHFYWTPIELVSSGFDPARYYNYAASLLRGEFVLDGLNYWGVVFFYYYLFSLLGLDPLVPLFLNVLLVLYICLLLANYLYYVGVPFHKSAFLLLIPEIVYYNDMSSREILCMSFSVFVLLRLYEYINKKKPFTNLIFPILILTLLIIIRPPYGICTILIGYIYILFSAPSTSMMKKTFYLIILIAVSVIGFTVTSSLDSSGADVGSSLSSSIENKIGGDNSTSDAYSYGQNSMAAYLIPHNPIQFILFGVIRSFLYVVITPADVIDPINSFNIITDKSGYIEWTTLIMMFMLPGVYRVIRYGSKSSQEIKLLSIACVLFFFLVGAFNTNLIQQRYRIVYDLYYFSLVLIYLSNKPMFTRNNIKPVSCNLVDYRHQN